MLEFSPTPYSMFDTLRVRNNEYTGMYRGTVLDNEDPGGRGRCKVYVYGVYDEKFKEDKGKNLPWAEPSQPLFCGGNGKNGTFQCPDLGATVWVFFDSGDITRPVMFGQTTDAESLKVDKTYQTAKTLFDTDSVTLYWEGMYVEMYKPTHTVTVSSENITAFASHDLSGHAENDVYIDAFHDINVYAKNDINVRADNIINISAGVDINVDAGNDITTDAGNNIATTAGNNITANAASNMLESAGSSTTRSSPFNTLNGNAHITGTAVIDSPTTINSSETVNGDATIGGRSFLGHIHIDSQGISTSPPI